MTREPSHGPDDRRSPSAWSPPATMTHVLIAACRSSETAKELTIGGRGRGGPLCGSRASSSGRTVGSPATGTSTGSSRPACWRGVEDQHPQLRDGGRLRPRPAFLGGALPARAMQLTLSRLPDGWSIDAGAVHGIPEPIGDDTTELAVYALGDDTDGAPLAEANVTAVLPDRSIVTITPELDPGFVYRAVVKTIPLKPRRRHRRGARPDRRAAAGRRLRRHDPDPTDHGPSCRRPHHPSAT